VTLLRVACIAILVWGLAGCGNGSGASEQAAPASSEPTPTTIDCEASAGAATSAQQSPALAERETMYLTNVGAHTDRCGDRITFEFKKSGSPSPGFNVSYQPAASAKIEDGSGAPVEIDGSAFLVVRLTPAMTAEISGEEVEPTYTGPRRIRPEGFSFVRDVVKTGDFEAIVTWVIGLDDKRAFKAAASRTQLVVEFPDS
jgi:hypothetical protein